MKNFPILILLLSLVGCTPVPVIPNLAHDSLKKIPYRHRPLIKMVASDYGRVCENILGRNFAEMGDEAYKNGFVVNASSLEVIKVTQRTKATVLYQNFSCGDEGDNPWRATNGIKIFLLVKSRVFEGWVSEAVYTEESDDGIILKLPQHPAMCGEYHNINDECIVSVRWVSGEKKFISEEKTNPLVEYVSPD